MMHIFPIYASCVSSGDHDQHQKVDILVNLRNQRSVNEIDLKELKISIYPKLHEVKTNLQAQRSGVSNHSQN